METNLKSIIMSFTKSVDMYNFLLKDHHRRVTIAAYHIGKAMELDKESLSDLVIAASLHDIGALSITERDELIHMDIEDPHPHARLGSYMLESFIPFKKISQIVFYHHWPFEWDSKWIKEKGCVPIESYILHLADRVDILLDQNIAVIKQKSKIKDKIMSYKGTLFHPQVVDAFLTVAKTDMFWLDIANLELEHVMDMGISKKLEVEMSVEMLEQFAFTISKIIDSRSKFTISHSFGVGAVAYELGKKLLYPEEKCRKLKVAGLLHDIGKIAISNEIIEKKGSLTSEERNDVQAHVYFTHIVLSNMEGMEEIDQWASHHHESHDGSGYPENLTENFLSEEMDIIAYADIYTSLSENRPYRKGFTTTEILNLLEHEFSVKHGRKIYEYIQTNVEEIELACKNAIEDGNKRFEIFEELSRKFTLETQIIY